MTPALEQHLRSLRPTQRLRTRRDSARALRAAWPHRHTDLRAREVVRANATMLRNLQSVEALS